MIRSFFDSVFRIAQPCYLPTDQDIIRCRVQTTGTSETNLTCNGISYRIPDVSGTLQGRSSWIHVFEDVASVIYVADIAAYDQVSPGNEAENRLQADRVLFGLICNLTRFKDTPIILFLNKGRFVQTNTRVESVQVQ